MLNPGIPRDADRSVGVFAASTGARSAVHTRVLALAGTLFALAGVVILLGIITAEATYPARYTTFENEISDLGATRPPNSIIRQPSARIFNATMLVSGAMILGGAAGLFRAAPQRRLGIWLTVVGVGVLGVGLFPGNRAPMHGIFALLAFVGGGGAAIVSGAVARGLFGRLAVVLGIIALVSLAVAMLGDLTPALDELGDGGVERWVAYPTVLWLVMFGGYLMGREQPLSSHAAQGPLPHE
jgi:hypothetical membrane protein